MGRDVTVKVRMSAEEKALLEERAVERRVTMSDLIRSLLFPTQAVPGMTTGDKIKRPTKALCVGCARTGRARWNCRECQPGAADAVAR